MRRPPRPLSSRRPRRAHLTADQLAAVGQALRAPLDGLLDMAQRLEDAGLAGEPRAYATALRESGEELLALVDDLIAFAALGAGETELLRPAAATGVRVLLAAGDPANALLVRTLLAREGCDVDHARTAEEALAAVKVGAYDLILADLHMAVPSGEPAVHRLRAQGIATAIVALTAGEADAARRAGLAAGVDDVLLRPISAEALRALLSRWVRGDWTPATARAKVG